MNSSLAFADKNNLLTYLDPEGHERPVTRPADWDKRRKAILTHMQEVMGPLPDASQKVPLDLQVNEVVQTPHYVRKKITYAAEKDDRVPAYLLIPLDRKGKLPAVLCLHQTIAIGKGEPAGLGNHPNLHYAVHLAERGYVTLAPDYLETLPEVDSKRIGCIGHSLGGHNAMFTAAFDTRIQALVSNCGFTSFPKYYGGDLKGWTSDRYMPRIASVYELKPEKVPFDFPEVVAAFAPRAFLASAPLHDDNFEVSGVRDCIAAARPVYELLGAKEKLTANYPDCGHDFPPEARKVAYQWLDRWLK